MPVRPVKKQQKVVGYKWGGSGKLYTVSKYGKAGAKAKSELQARAIYASGYKGKSSVRKHIRRLRHGKHAVIRSHMRHKRIPTITSRERKIFTHLSSAKNYNNEFGGGIDFNKRKEIERFDVEIGKEGEVMLPDYEVLYHTHNSPKVSLPSPEDIMVVLENNKQQTEIVFNNGQAFVITKTKETQPLSRKARNKKTKKQLFKDVEQMWKTADKAHSETQLKKSLEGLGFDVQISHKKDVPIKLDKIKVVE
jgi:hypothetical protein